MVSCFIILQTVWNVQTTAKFDISYSCLLEDIFSFRTFFNIFFSLNPKIQRFLKGGGDGTGTGDEAPETSQDLTLSYVCWQWPCKALKHMLNSVHRYVFIDFARTGMSGMQHLTGQSSLHSSSQTLPCYNSVSDILMTLNINPNSLVSVESGRHL